MPTRICRWVTDHPIAFALIFFVFYLIGFFTLEQLITEPVYLIHCTLDDWIPFNEWFIFAYGSWFFLIPWALITLLRRDRSNYFYPAAWLVQAAWSMDTSTNVCPSIHVASTLAILFAVWRSHIWHHRKLVVGGCTLLTVLICLSTLFLKQHSVVDVLCGIALTVLLHLAVTQLYRKFSRYSSTSCSPTCP